MNTAGADDRDWRTALLLELLPVAAGLLILALVALTSLQPADSDGQTWTRQALDWGPLPLRVALSFALFAVAAAFVAVFFLFFFSGVGWIISGHRVIGFVLLIARGFISIGVVDYGGSERQTVLSFSVSMAMGAASVLGLILATRPRPSSLLTPSSE